MYKYEQVSSINKISVWTKYGDPSLYDNGEADLTWFQSIKKKFNNFVKDHSMMIHVQIGFNQVCSVKMFIFAIRVPMLKNVFRGWWPFWISDPHRVLTSQETIQ
jgi:hypothetical protein